MEATDSRSLMTHPVLSKVSGEQRSTREREVMDRRRHGPREEGVELRHLATGNTLCNGTNNWGNNSPLLPSFIKRNVGALGHVDASSTGLTCSVAPLELIEMEPRDLQTAGRRLKKSGRTYYTTTNVQEREGEGCAERRRGEAGDTDASSLTPTDRPSAAEQTTISKMSNGFSSSARTPARRPMIVR